MEERKAAVLGSPEHQLLKEAGALKPQGRHPLARKGANDEETELPARQEETRTVCEDIGNTRAKIKKGIGDRDSPEP